MATFIATLRFTKQGIKDIKDTRKRAEAFRSTAKKMKVKVADIFWTLGPADGLIVFDAPNEETATALMLKIGSQGNIQTQTSRAFRTEEMAGILAKLSK